MGVLATLVGLDAEPAPAAPKFADAQAFLDAVKQRYPKGTRIYEHFKIAMAAYGAGPKTTAAKTPFGTSVTSLQPAPELGLRLTVDPEISSTVWPSTWFASTVPNGHPAKSAESSPQFQFRF